jgi:hypothetical protein
VLTQQEETEQTKGRNIQARKFQYPTANIAFGHAIQGFASFSKAR